MIFPLTPLAPAAHFIWCRSLTSAAGAFFLRFARSAIPTIVLAATLAVFIAAPADASGVLPELRLATTYRGTSDVTTYAGAWYSRAPRWTRAERLEMSLGVIDDKDSARAFVFVGPVWRFAKDGAAPFFEFSFGPTALAGSTVGGRELGGNLHFRSALVIGTTLGAHHAMEVAIRISHLSNGGLRDANPGLDLIGLSFIGGIGAR